MRVKYSFSSRKTKRATKSPKLRKQKEKYPDLVRKIIEQSDIVLEVLDARFVREMRDKELESEIKTQNKKLIYVLNKADLARKNNAGLKSGILVSCKTRSNIKKLRDKIKAMSKKISKSDGRILVGVVGYPNTGKSSLINLLIGKSSAGTGAEAGFTKGVQKLKLTSNILLLDTPGVIPEKDYSNIEKDKIMQHVIVGGRSYSQVKDPEMVIAKLIEDYPGVLEKYFKINAGGDCEILLEKLGMEKGFLKKGGRVNVDKTARFILKEWQDGGIIV